MFGPIPTFELFRAARRGRHHQMRSLYALALALEGALLLILCASTTVQVVGPFQGPPHERIAALLTDGLAALVLQQFAFVLLVAPAFTAGAISDEKATGTLEYLLASPLSSREIIVGKWFALVVQLLVLGAPAVPLLLFLGVFAGLGTPQILALLVQPVAPLAALVAAGLLASVWSRHTTQALSRLYGFLTLVAVAAAFLGPKAISPLPVWSACQTGSNPWPALGQSSLLWAGVTLLCLLLAAWRLRPAFRRQLPGESGGATPASRRWRPRVGNQPLRWKERHFGRIAFLHLLAYIPQTIQLAAVLVVTALVWLACIVAQLPPGATLFGLVVAVWRHEREAFWARAGGPPSVGIIAVELAVVVLAGLLVAVRSAASITGERERQTWEVLLLTPLTTEQLLRGKLWGTLDAARPYLIAHAVAAMPLSVVVSGEALFMVVILWLAAWIGMYFAGSVGLECSSRARVSWIALLGALVRCFRDVVARCISLSLPIGFLGGAVAVMLLGLLNQPMGADPFFYGFFPTFLTCTTALLLGESERQIETARERIECAERGAGGPDLFRRVPVEQAD